MIVRYALVLATLAIASLAPSSVHARRRAVATPPPATLSLSPMTEGPNAAWRRVLEVRADAPLDLTADRRLLRLEVLPAGARRPLRCESPDRPPRGDARVRHLEAGERWAEWIDLREYCWGRALTALRAGADVTAYFGPRTRSRGSFAVRANGVDHREIGPASFHVEALPIPAAAAGALAVRVADADASTLGSLTLRTSVRASAPTRAYVRRDRLSFRVTGDGGSFDCAITWHGGAAPAELFTRVTSRGGPSFALAAREFCPPEAMRIPGIYEVVPTLVVDQDGASQGVREATMGTFEGPAAIVRVRRGETGYVERPIDAGR